MARLILTISILVSLLLSIVLALAARAQDFPATVSYVNDDPKEPFLWLIFDSPAEAAGRVPLGQNRGYWIEGLPPVGLTKAVTRRDRIVYRMRWIQLLSLARLEYRVPKGPQTLVFSLDPPMAFWGPVVLIGVSPFFVGILGAGIAAIAGAITSRARRA